MFGTKPYWSVTEKCQRAICYNDQMNPDYSKEHTKPIFKSKNLFIVRNLYNYHILIELYKVMKFRQPYSVFCELSISDRKIMLKLNKLKLDKRKSNFFYNAALKWNQVNKLLITPYVIHVKNNIDGGVSPTMNYDLTLSVSALKSKLKKALFGVQCIGDESEWCTLNAELTACTTSTGSKN